MSFEFFTSLVFLRNFHICPMFFMFEWFLMVSISVFKCSFAGSVAYFSMIVSKISCNFYFVYYVRNLALVRKGTIKLIYIIMVSYLCFLFRDYFFIMHIDNWFNIYHYFCWTFYDIYGRLENVFELKEGNIYQYFWRCSLKKAGRTRWCFRFLDDLLFSFSLFDGFYWSL